MVQRFRPISLQKHQCIETAHSRKIQREKHYATNKKGTKQNTLPNCNISLIWGLHVLYICELSQALGKQVKTQKSFSPWMSRLIYIRTRFLLVPWMSCWCAPYVQRPFNSSQYLASFPRKSNLNCSIRSQHLVKIGKTHHEIGLSADEAQVHIQMFHYTSLHTHSQIHTNVHMHRHLQGPFKCTNMTHFTTETNVLKSQSLVSKHSNTPTEKCIHWLCF